MNFHRSSVDNHTSSRSLATRNTCGEPTLLTGCVITQQPWSYRYMFVIVELKLGTFLLVWLYDCVFELRRTRCHSSSCIVLCARGSESDFSQPFPFSWGRVVIGSERCRSLAGRWCRFITNKKENPPPSVVGDH
jgi:hypothetical protein